MTPVLSVEDLSVGYRAAGGTVRALRHVSVAVHKGEVLGIMGESGCGKSTLAAAMINLLPPGARVKSGAVRLNGTDVQARPLNAEHASREIALVWRTNSPRREEFELLADALRGLHAG